VYFLFNFSFKIAATNSFIVNRMSEKAPTYSKIELKKLIKEAYVETFRGPAQNVGAYDEAVYYESLLREMKQNELEAEHKPS
jgi:hypothetical protein